MDQGTGSLIKQIKKKKENITNGSRAKKKGRFICDLPSADDVQPLPGKQGLSTRDVFFRG